MKSLRESSFGIACVLTLVACGYAYLKYADEETGALPFVSGAKPGRQFPGMSVRAIDWSVDSRLLLSLSHGQVGPDGPLLVHDRAGARIAFDIDGEEHMACAVLSRDGRHVLIGTHRGQLLWIDTESSQSRVLFELPEPRTLKPVSLSPDGRTAATAIDVGQIFLCDVNRAAPPRVIQGPPSSLAELSFSSDGRRLVGASMDGWASIWELAEGRTEWQLAAHDGRTTAAALLPGGHKFITAGSDGTVRVWNVAEQREEWTGQFERGATDTFAVAPDGKTAAWAGLSYKILIWDLERRRKEFEIAVPSSSVMRLRFSPDGKILAAAGLGGKIRLYDTATGTELPGIDAGSATPHR
jgi:WD40 repeat protein